MQLLVYFCPWIIWSRKIYWIPLGNFLYVFMIFFLVGGENVWDLLLGM